VADYTVGQELAADLWEAGERVDAIAVSKGKGFAGGMKRHNFKGQGASHGNHRSHRVPGAIGACATPSRVFKGTRMAGQMGGTQVTALNLEVVSADAERELVEWKKVKFMRDRVGDEFDALIVSVTKFGFFVELMDMFIEGLVPIVSCMYSIDLRYH